MVERQLPKLIVRVRFPSPAPRNDTSLKFSDLLFVCLLPSAIYWPLVVVDSGYFACSDNVSGLSYAGMTG